MAVFEVQSGGKTYEIEAPDQATAVKAIESLMQSAPKPDPAKMAAGPVKTAETSTLADVSKSVGSGLVTGTEALLGMPGDIADLARAGGTWLGNKARTMGGKAPIEGLAPDPIGLSSIPGTPEIAKANEAVTGFTPYQPKTTAGEFANTAASFVPGAMAFGGGGVGAMAGNALKYGVVPGVASEAAGQLTEGTAWEPLARTGAAVAAGVGMNALTRPKPAAAPSAADLKAQGGALYKSLDTAQGQVVLEPSAYTRIADDLGMAAAKARLGTTKAPKAAAILKDFQDMAAAGVAPDLLELDGLRSQLGTLLKSSDATERFFASMLRDKLDDAIAGLKPADVIAGDPNAALKTLADARNLWSRSKKVELLDGLMEQAKNAVGANYTSAGLMTAVKQKFRALAGRKDYRALFSAAERDAIRQIIRGTPTEKVTRFLGKFDPRSPLMAMMLGGVGFSGNPLLAGAVAGAGVAGKTLAGRTAQRAVDSLSEMIATGVVPPGQPSALNLPLSAFYGATELNRSRNAPLKVPVGGAPPLDPLGLAVSKPR